MTSTKIESDEAPARGEFLGTYVADQYAQQIIDAKCAHDLDAVLANCCASLVGRIIGQLDDLLRRPIGEDARPGLASLLADAQAISATNYGDPEEVVEAVPA